MDSLLAMSMPGWPEIIVIMVVVLLLFGAKKLPELARGLAQSLNEFRKARDEFETELKKPAQSPTVQQPAEKQEAHKPS